jgi:hypothetical protein
MFFFLKSVIFYVLKNKLFIIGGWAASRGGLRSTSCLYGHPHAGAEPGGVERGQVPPLTSQILFSHLWIFFWIPLLPPPPPQSLIKGQIIF